MKAIIAAVTLAALPVAVQAQEVPRYDPEGHCQTIAGDSARLYNHCVQREQESYNNLRAVWDQVPARVRSHCGNLLDNYRLLEHCVEREMQAQGSRPSFSFD